MKTDKQIAASAAEFAERWKGKGYERGQSPLFWADLLTNVFGVENLLEFLRYEEQVYNAFPWPTPTEAQKAKIEQTAQTILELSDGDRTAAAEPADLAISLLC